MDRLQRTHLPTADSVLERVSITLRDVQRGKQNGNLDVSAARTQIASLLTNLQRLENDHTVPDDLLKSTIQSVVLVRDSLPDLTQHAQHSSHSVDRYGMDAIDAWRIKFLSSITSGLRKQQRSGEYCDVAIKVEGVVFRCHKAVLCAASPYFTAMFAHDMKESRDAAVTLHETKAEMFELLLDCIYDGASIVTEDNVQDILEIATLMQIDILLEYIEEYFRQIITVENFVDIWYMAKKFSCQRLEKFIWTFMTDNFVALSDSGDLSLLPLETMERFLSDDSLVAKSEDLICDVILRWLSADLENRREYAPKLITQMRLPLCSSEYILQQFSKDTCVNQLPEALPTIKQALKFKMFPARKQDSTSVQTTHRRTSAQDDVMVVIGGTDTSEYSGTGMRCYSFLRRKWFNLPSLPQNVGPHYAICTYGDDIFVSGGQYHREAFHRFQSATCAWVALPQLPSGRFQHAMASVTDVIYVIGGDGSVDSTLIYGYNVSTGSWQEYCERPDRIPYAHAVAFNQSILIYGGKASESQQSDYVFTFDTFRNQVTRITSLTLPGLGTNAVMFDSSAYIIGTDGAVTKVTHDFEKHVVRTIENFNPKRFASVQYRGILYVIVCSPNLSGSSSEFPKVLVIDPSNEMSLLETILVPAATPRGAPWLGSGTRLASVKISISKHHLKEV